MSSGGCELHGNYGEILVVDDAARMRGLVAKVLAQEGYSVRALPPARDVLQALEEGSADLVASDIRMSEMDGLTLLLHQETVRLMPARPCWSRARRGCRCSPPCSGYRVAGTGAPAATASERRPAG